MSPSILKTPSTTTSFPWIGLSELVLEVVEVAVPETDGLTGREAASVDHARMIELVDEHRIIPSHQGRDDPQIRLEAGREDERRFLPGQLREPMLDPLVQLRIAIEEPAPRASGPVLRRRRLGGRDDARVVTQAEVVVGSDHHPALSVDDDFGRAEGIHRHEYGTDPSPGSSRRVTAVLW